MIRVAIALLDDGEDTITQAHLPEELLEEAAATLPVAPRSDSLLPAQGASLATNSQEEIELRAVAQALEAHGVNISAAARMLGVSRNTLFRKLGRL